MFNEVVAAMLLALIVVVISLSGYRAVSGYHTGFYRIAVICMIVGLNFNTTEPVTGNVMSEFGLFMLFAGLFIGCVLVAVDAYTGYGKLLAKRRQARAKQPNGEAGLTD
ncbi:hypothetical protein [Rhodoferax antarcticus]|nr:hypothetical protein [Rhodoferax antarcticus]